MPTEALSRAAVARLFGTWTASGRPGGERAQRRPGRGARHRRHRPGGDRRRVPGRGARAGGPGPAGQAAARLAGPDGAAGSADLLGPSTLRALHLVAAGAPAGTTGRWGDTDGAAMRVAPLGVATPPEPLDRLCAAVADLDRLTHDTTVANAGACAVAAVVSAGVAGAGWAEAAALGLQAAAAAGRLGSYVPEPTSAAASAGPWTWSAAPTTTRCSTWSTGWSAPGWPPRRPCPRPSPWPRRAATDPWRAGLLAARLGGDSDTIAAMARRWSAPAPGSAPCPRRPSSRYAGSTGSTWSHWSTTCCGSGRPR